MKSNAIDSIVVIVVAVAMLLPGNVRELPKPPANTLGAATSDPGMMLPMSTLGVPGTVAPGAGQVDGDVWGQPRDNPPLSKQACSATHCFAAGCGARVFFNGEAGTLVPLLSCSIIALLACLALVQNQFENQHL